ncbi:MAG: adenylate/guanylate cyclase domain-containing protein [Myxococcales bacterium]|nr:adenylate/guanylate cyclase domain-containing protein [Myxococcales bacterium]
MASAGDLVTAPPSLGELLSRHPWPKELTDKGRPLEFLWHFELDATPSELWPFISDTSRLNRAMGVTRMSFEERDGVLHGSAVNGGFLQEWVEVPWTWVAEREMTSVRLYSRGFAHSVRGIFELHPLGERTRVSVYFGWVPRGFWQRWLLGIGMRPLQREFSRVLGEVERTIGDARRASNPFVMAPPALSEEARRRLDELGKRLVADGVEPELVRRIAEHLSSADEMDLFRIQILPLARRWKQAEDAVLEAFLKATRIGLLSLSWDVICPHCRGVRSEVRTLGELPQRGDCKACGIDFETASDEAIEVTFHVHPSIREVQRQFFCSAEPAFKSHIKLQQLVPPGERLRCTTALAPGRYRLRVSGVPEARALEVREESEAAEVEWKPGADVAPESRPSPELVLENDADEPRTFVVETPTWSDDALRPARLLSFQQFRDLFTEEYLGSDVQLSVGRQTILFTDVVGSTKLYATRGDPGAFVDVKRHFTEILEVVKQHHGAIVKTIGDAAMAAFPSPVDALAAAEQIQLRLPPGREDLSIRVRASINAGPCIAVNLNTNLDYFGNTVNLAAKLQACAEAGQIAFPAALLDQPGVKELLESKQAELHEESFETPGAGAMGVLRWDVNP